MSQTSSFRIEQPKISPVSKEISTNTFTMNNQTLTVDEARSWIGEHLVLRRKLRHFKPGTKCVVMCSVDFGDGLLLWVTTDDESFAEVDQMNLADLLAYFDVQEHGYEHGGKIVHIGTGA